MPLEFLSEGFLVEGLVALGGGALGWFGGQRAERRAHRDFRLAVNQLASDWRRDLRIWASEVVEVLAEASVAAPGIGETEWKDEEIRRRCRWKLSSLVDRGRFFLPNSRQDEIETYKPAAYRGLRPKALDLLVSAHNFTIGSRGTDWRAALAATDYMSVQGLLIRTRRQFVSEIQVLLDPRTEHRDISQLLAAAAADPEEPTAWESLTGSREPPPQFG